MATLTRVNGGVVPGVEFVGRDLQFFTIGQSDVSAAELESIILAIQQFCTIEAIGACTFGTSDTVNIAVSGNGKTAAELETAAAAAVAGTTVTALAF